MNARGDGCAGAQEGCQNHCGCLIRQAFWQAFWQLNFRSTLDPSALLGHSGARLEPLARASTLAQP